MFWWFTLPDSADEMKGWSREEKAVRVRILVIAIALAVILTFKFQPALDQFDLFTQLAIGFTELAIGPAGLFLCGCVGRLFCRLFFRDLVRVADRNAARRLTGFGTE